MVKNISLVSRNLIQDKLSFDKVWKTSKKFCFSLEFEIELTDWLLSESLPGSLQFRETHSATRYTVYNNKSESPLNLYLLAVLWIFWENIVKLLYMSSEPTVYKGLKRTNARAVTRAFLKGRWKFEKLRKLRKYSDINVNNLYCGISLILYFLDFLVNPGSVGIY